jgi:DNA-directed RNA polymerase specialized sigma24 family protein
MAGADTPNLSLREAASAATSAVKAMQAESRHAEARERYADLVGQLQRRTSRIAFHYLRDGAEADEAVQDAFVRAYTHLASLPDELPFEVWLNRILINSCLDRIKARTRVRLFRAIGRLRTLLTARGHAGNDSRLANARDERR